MALVGWAAAASACGWAADSFPTGDPTAASNSQNSNASTQAATGGSDSGKGSASSSPAEATTGSSGAVAAAVAPFSSAALATVDLTSPQALAAPSPSGAVLMAGLNPNLCVDVDGGLEAEGVSVLLNSCRSPSAASWTLSASRVRFGSKCLTLPDASQKNAAPRLATCETDATKAAAQMWLVTGGMLASDAPAGAERACLTASGATLAAGTKLGMFPCDATNSLQKWGLANRTFDGGGNLLTIGARWGWVGDLTYCLDTVGGAVDGNVKVQPYTCNQHQAQRWNLANGQMLHQDRCLTAQGGTAGTLVDTRLCAPSTSATAAFQAWGLNKGALQLAGTQLCACVSGSPTTSPQLTLLACDVTGSGASLPDACRWAPGKP